MVLIEAVLYSPYRDEVVPLFKELGIRELPQSRTVTPRYVVTYGGDGSFLMAERDWPGVPKVVLRRSRVCKRCLKKVPRLVLENLSKREHRVKEYPKISFHFGLTQGVACNDIILRNWNPNQALRFCLEDVRGATVPEGEIIGDGVVLATQIGARAYYGSIVRSGFRGDFGLAFNNPTKSLKPVYLKKDFSITVRILRENALLCLDNLPSFCFLREGDRFRLTDYPQTTRIVDILKYYCPTCRKHLTF